MEFFNELTGHTGEGKIVLSMAARAVIVFFLFMIYVRIAGLRTFGKKSIFDQITVLMIGALLAKAIIKEDSFLGIICAAAVLMLLHRMIAWLCAKSKRAEHLFKGDPIQLIRNGEFLSHNMRKTHITREDIMEALRTELNVNDLGQVKHAYLEPSGEISLVKRQQ